MATARCLDAPPPPPPSALLTMSPAGKVYFPPESPSPSTSASLGPPRTDPVEKSRGR